MGILILTLIVIVLIVLYIKRRKQARKAKEEQKIFIKKREEKEGKLRKLKDEEDLELNAEESVLCDDGVERKYSKSMYGIIKEYSTFIVNEFHDGNKSVVDLEAHIRGISISTEKFTRSSYYLGKSKTPDPFLLNKHGRDLYEDRVLSFISTEKWFSEKGKLLNSAEILNLYYLAKKKSHTYENKYYRRGLNADDRPAKIFIINDIYFIETNALYASEFLGFKLFDGKLNDIQYKQGKRTH